MLPRKHPDRIQITFDDHRLVANAGLLLPVTLAQHLGLRQLVDSHVDLGDAPGRANTGDKIMTLVASALAGGDCIDDADALRTGGTDGALGGTVKAPSTLGTFLRSFRWGHVRQLDRVSRELLARAWGAGAGPGDAPLTTDLDSTICETYGLAKEGARHHSYAGQRGYHPLLAIAAETGDVLMSRLREGCANTARGGAHFLRETVGRVRHAGARGQLTVRADSGFHAHALVAVCRKMDVRFSITIRQHVRLRNLIEAIPETDWTPIPYWMDGAADVAETTYTPFQSEPDAAPVRLIVRRVKPTPGSQLALFATYGYHGFIIIRCLGLSQQLRYLRRQLRCLLLHPLVTHRLMLRCVGLDLRAVQRHVPQLHQPRLLAQRQYLYEQARQRIQIILAKVGDGPEVRCVVRRQHPEGDVLVETLGDAASGRHPHAVAVEQHLDHHPWMIRWPATPFPLVASGDLRHVQLVPPRRI